ncbi:MAG TPA: NUDIX hydrolase [Yinghuangia sp.]|nr:NUDIX hydrolase [Yinghuangia sp.]
MKWRNHGEREVATTEWFTLKRADVELPDGRRLDHYLTRHRPAAMATILDTSDRVLLLWRHRFITDTWGWELAAGAVDPGETPEAAARREMIEETGWRPGELRHLATVEPSNGFSDAAHHIYWSPNGEYLGPPVDDFESDRVEWVPLKDVPDMVARGEIRSANAVAGLLLLHRLRGL